jgi:hypothetical protein
LQALVEVVHSKQARMVAQAVVHPVQLVPMVVTQVVVVEHKLRVEPLVEQVQALVLHCRVEALLIVVMVVVVVVVVVVIGVVVVVQVPILVLLVAVGLDTLTPHTLQVESPSKGLVPLAVALVQKELMEMQQWFTFDKIPK